MPARVSANKQHQDTFLIHPLVQSGMRIRKNDETSSLTMSTVSVQMFTYMAGVIVFHMEHVMSLYITW